MIEDILSKTENKTLEFKENAHSLNNIVKTVIAFTNTAGGMIIIGIEDKTKALVGVENILSEEERIASTLADNIEPLIIPDIDIITYRKKEFLIIHIPHLVGPHYLKKAGPENGVYIRLGSTNRIADPEMLESLRLLAKHTSFDELPCVGASFDTAENDFIKERFEAADKKINATHYKSLGIHCDTNGSKYPTNAAILLFSDQRTTWFPDTIIRCVAYRGADKDEIHDQLDIELGLIKSINEIIIFINKHATLSAEIGLTTRKDIHEYPQIAIREIVINAILHSDYSITGTAIQIAIFNNRIEITNPGGLPFGQTLSSALAGISKLRNKIIGRLFRQIKLIEQLGSGLRRVIKVYQQLNTKKPKFEEINHNFRATLYPRTEEIKPLVLWQIKLLDSLKESNTLTTKDIAAIWGVTTRTARTRLKEMLDLGLINKIATSEKDPNAVFILASK